MDDETAPPKARAEYFRSVADRLRGTANGLRYDFRRADQLRALADGFERFAHRIEQEQLTNADNGRPQPSDLRIRTIDRK